MEPHCAKRCPKRCPGGAGLSSMLSHPRPALLASSTARLAGASSSMATTRPATSPTMKGSFRTSCAGSDGKAVHAFAMTSNCEAPMRPVTESFVITMKQPAACIGLRSTKDGGGVEEATSSQLPVVPQSCAAAASASSADAAARTPPAACGGIVESAASASALASTLASVLSVGVRYRRRRSRARARLFFALSELRDTGP